MSYSPYQHTVDIKENTRKPKTNKQKLTLSPGKGRTAIWSPTGALSCTCGRFKAALRRLPVEAGPFGRDGDG